MNYNFKLSLGVSWLEMHLLAERVILEELISNGFLRGDIEDMVRVRLAAIFMPCGMGHLLGLDIHDVGGYPEAGPLRPLLTDSGQAASMRAL